MSTPPSPEHSRDGIATPPRHSTTPASAPEPKHSPLGVAGFVASLVGTVLALISTTVVIGWVILGVALLLLVIALGQSPSRKALVVWGLVVTLLGAAASVYLSLNPLDQGGTSSESETSADAETDAGSGEQSADPTDTSTEQGSTDPSASTEPTAAPTALPTEPGFEASEVEGSGNAVVPLPEGAQIGIVTASYQGEDEFSVTVLDGTGTEIGDDLVDAEGGYEGTTAYGLEGIGAGQAGTESEGPTDLRVEATGDWTLTIAPIQDAPALELPARSQGDAVLQWDQPATAATLTTLDEATVRQVTARGEQVLINDEVAQIVVLDLAEGPAIVVIRTDGAWTVE